VASMGGSVSLSSLGTGQGATFCILIPLDRLYANGDESLAPRTMTRSSSEDNIGKCFDADGPIVRVVLAAGPTSDTLSSLVKQCGAQVSVTNFGVESVPAETDLRQLQADIDHASAKHEARTRPNYLFILEGKVVSQLLKLGCTGLSRVPLLIVGSHQENKEMRAMGAWAYSVFMPRPLKLSVFIRKAYCVLNQRPCDHVSPHTTGGAEDNSPSAEVHQLAAGGKGKDAGAGGESATRKLRILLVEDHQVNQKVVLAMVGKILGKANVEIDIGNDGKEGLDKATAAHKCLYDLVLMDIQMPGMDGLEATRRIREWETKVGESYYIVALTAHANQTDVQDCLAAGMDRYMSKPINMKDMKNLLAELKEGKLKHVS